MNVEEAGMIIAPILSKLITTSPGVVLTLMGHYMRLTGSIKRGIALGVSMAVRFYIIAILTLAGLALTLVGYIAEGTATYVTAFYLAYEIHIHERELI